LKLKILKKLRTASLNSEFTGSYKKVYCWFQNVQNTLSANYIDFVMKCRVSQWGQ